MTLMLQLRLRSPLFALISLVSALAMCQDAAFATPPAANADYDGNGVVDQGDLVKWSEGFGCGAPNSDGAGFLEWQRQLGQRSMPVVLVPEPATYFVWGGLALFGGTCCLLNRRKAQVL